MTFVVDTNVAIVANNREWPSPECVLACAQRLREIVDTGRIALDAGDQIFGQYRGYLSFSGQPGVGDVFFKWVFDHYWNDERCDRVAITPEGKSYKEFPADERLAAFHWKDRMFVAVAAVHPEHPPILQATDTKWHNFAVALAERGVNLQFLCA
jgi:hypothetical protein